ncbi:MAG: YbgA family protein [Halioglobus sp.]|nr:YbgA family protein [Halioglobus sp.]
MSILADEFIATLMAALSHRTTRRSHSNVLYHLSSYLKKTLSGEERQRLRDLIEQYCTGQVPLIVPITMLKHHFANRPNACIDNQVFIPPLPGLAAITQPLIMFRGVSAVPHRASGSQM